MDATAHELLLIRIKNADADAFGEWMGSVEPSLRLSLRSFAATVDVEAVLQEALLRAWNVAERVEPDGKAYVLFRVTLRIARNLAVSERRRVRRTVTDDDTLAAIADDATPSFGDPLLLQRVRECHARLPDKPRAALTARLESQGAEADELLAERLAMRLNTFLQNFTRARKLLVECLRAMGVDIAELA